MENQGVRGEGEKMTC